MKSLILVALMTPALAMPVNAQSTANTRTICKGQTVPGGFVIVGEVESSDCPQKAWIIKRTPKLVIDRQPDGGVPQVVERDSEPNETGPGSEDVQFAKRTFELLSSGDIAVEEMIDWDHLKLTGMNFGEIMKDLAKAKKQDVTTFRREMIANFGEQYRTSGEPALTQWRVYSEDGDGTTVAANTSKGQVLLFKVSQQDGRRIITALDEKKPGQR